MTGFSHLLEKVFKENLTRGEKMLAIAIVASFFLISTSFYPLLAYVRSSNNYKIQMDSVNTEGGDGMTSVNYIYRDTMGEVSSGLASSALYDLKAGYRQMNETYLTVSSPSDILMSPSIPGITGGLASGDATWTIITDNPAGFNMKVKASGETGMLQTNDWYFYEYTPASAGSADFNWSAPAAGSAEYGYSVTAETSVDIDTPFKNDGANCGTGGNNTDKQCWYKFATSDLQVIYRSSRTDDGGENEKINFQAQSNSQFLKEGYYDSYIIITVVAN